VKFGGEFGYPKASVEFLGVQELIYEAPCGRWKVPMQGSNTWGVFNSGAVKFSGVL
jgi:hypothetical protein